MDQIALVAWSTYWGEAQSVGFAPLLAAKVVFNEITKFKTTKRLVTTGLL